MVLTFGEILLRLSPDEESNWLTENNLNVYPAGSELNVATALANWKLPVSYCTAVPHNFLSAQLIRKIESRNIDVSTIIHHGNKLGIYYLPEKKELQHADIIHDKIHSSFYDLKAGMIDWEKVLQGIRWFHFSAASACLNENVAAVYEEALRACAKKSITVSVDINYRTKLPDAEVIMPKLLEYADIIVGNIWSAESILDIKIPDNIHSISTRENYTRQAKHTSEEIMKRFPKCKVIANMFRLRKNNMEYFATIFGNNSFYTSASYATGKVIDESGSADCFMAGLIYGTYNHLPFQQLVNFATGAGFQKLLIKGESIDKTTDEIKSFILHYH